MLTEDVLNRLGQLNRQTLVDAAASPRAIPPTPRRQLSLPATSELPPGVEVETTSGKHWLIEAPIGTVWAEGPRNIERGREERAASAQSELLHVELRSLAEHFPHGAAFVDLETCGFAGSTVFLAGVLHQDARGLMLSQLLARDYSEEKALLQSLWQLLDRKQVLVTFNGKSFDWPAVRDRSTLYHLGPDMCNQDVPGTMGNVESAAMVWVALAEPRPQLLHCDLLHHARRRWKDRLPNCRLQTLERFVCGRHRVGDIAGRDIPRAYHNYVRTRDAWEMRSVLHHNALDLVTLLQLSLRLVV